MWSTDWLRFRCALEIVHDLVGSHEEQLSHRSFHPLFVVLVPSRSSMVDLASTLHVVKTSVFGAWHGASPLSSRPVWCTITSMSCLVSREISLKKSNAPGVLPGLVLIRSRVNVDDSGAKIYQMKNCRKSSSSQFAEILLIEITTPTVCTFSHVYPLKSLHPSSIVWLRYPSSS